VIAAVFLIIGVLLILATVLFRISRPRRSGEPLGPVRAVLLGLGLMGWLCVLTSAVMYFGS